MTDYTIYSIKTFNNNNLVFYNYTKQKRINDVLSSYKSRYKRYLNKCDNFMNIFYILQADKSYIKIEEKITTDNEDNVKSKLYDYIANNNCINKLDTDQIENLSNKIEITENENLIKIELKSKIDEPKREVIEEVIIEPTIIEEPKREVIDNYFNTEPTKIVEDVADISNNQVELLNDTITEINEATNNIKVVKNLADVKCIDNVYEPSITSSSRHSKKSFKEEFEELCKSKPNNKTIKYNFKDTIRFLNSRKTLKKHQE